MASNRKKGERFAKIPMDVMQHPAVTTLPHAAFRVLVVIAAGYNGGNNGAMSCTDTWMQKFGISSRDTTYRSLKLLRDRGLIEVTRPGIKHKKIPTLYAVAWQEMNLRAGEIMGRFTPASHAYLDWRPPERAKKKTPKGGKKSDFQSDGRESTSPMVGNQTVRSSPTSPTKVAICSPMIGNNLDSRKDSFGSASGIASPALAPAPVAVSIPLPSPPKHGESISISVQRSR